MFSTPSRPSQGLGGATAAASEKYSYSDHALSGQPFPPEQEIVCMGWEGHPLGNPQSSKSFGQTPMPVPS